MQCMRSFDGSNGDPQFVRCVHPRTDAAPWEIPAPLPPLCSVVVNEHSPNACPAPWTLRPGHQPRSNAGTLLACTQGRDLFEANGAAPWHAARVVGSNTLRESAARAQLRLDSGSTPAREDARRRQCALQHSSVWSAK